MRGSKGEHSGSSNALLRAFLTGVHVSSVDDCFKCLHTVLRHTARPLHLAHGQCT